MKKNLFSLLIVCLVPLLFTACPKRKPLPTPQDTAVSRVGGKAQGLGGADRNLSSTSTTGSTFEGDLDGGLLPRSDIEAFNSNTLVPNGFFDQSGNPIKVFDQFGNEISPDDVFDSSIRSFDANGNPITVFDAYGNPLNAYDANGNPITVYDANGNPISPYDENGNLRPFFDANGNPVSAYDKNGKALAAVNPNYSPVSASGDSTPYDSSQVVGQVYFGYDQYFISPEARQSLTDVQDYLSQNPSAKILLVGHCSWHGTADYNLLLGDKRANTVFEYLTNLGVSSSRMETLSRGDLDATEGASKADSAQDRRVDVVKVN